MIKRISSNSLILGLCLCLFLPSPASGPEQSVSTDLRAGQTATLLPDGRWLTVGGEGRDGPLATAAIWDPHGQVTLPLSHALQHARAGHSATLLSDGTILILGGVGADGQAVDVAEIFDPDTETFEPLATIGLTPRTYHTATLLTDGRVLIVGGISATGNVLATAELWDSRAQTAELLQETLEITRYTHTATLQPNGSVLLSGGLGQDHTPLTNGELYSPETQRFLMRKGGALRSSPATGALRLQASLPKDGAVDVPIGSLIALRFSHPLDVETVNADTLTLTGPEGGVAAKVMPAEGGLLAFITPQTPLLAGAAYTLSLNRPTDRSGLSLPVTAVSFMTGPSVLRALRSDRQGGSGVPPGGFSGCLRPTRA